MPSPLARVYATPADLDLRSVVADQLQQQGDPRGELIAAQLAIADGTRTAPLLKRAKQLQAELASELIGPIAKVVTTLAKKKCVELDRGFPSAIRLDRRNVPRADWERAAKAVEWATVRRVDFSVLTTPLWWVQKWAKNPAAKRSLVSFAFTSCQLVRETPSSAWVITQLAESTVYHSALLAFLSPAERKTVSISAKVPANRRRKAEQTLGR